MVCEEGIYEVKAISKLLVPQSSKIVLAQKPQTVLKKTKMYCTNYHMTNHNVETYRIKRKKTMFLQSLRLLLDKIKYRGL